MYQFSTAVTCGNCKHAYKDMPRVGGHFIQENLIRFPCVKCRTLIEVSAKLVVIAPEIKRATGLSTKLLG